MCIYKPTHPRPHTFVLTHQGQTLSHASPHPGGEPRPFKHGSQALTAREWGVLGGGYIRLQATTQTHSHTC